MSQEKKWAEMALLKPEELAGFIHDCPIVYVPTGIYEWHDAHNPMGTDTLKMVEIARRTAVLTGGLVHMPVYIGVGAFYEPINGLNSGGINFDEGFVTRYLVLLCEQLERLGFELIVLLYGHTNPGNINAHETACRCFMSGPGANARVLALNDFAPVVKHRYKVADHAAKWETSFMLASFPEHVDLERIPADHGPWWGLDPALHASAAEGERMYSLIAEETAKLVKTAASVSQQALLEGRFPVPEKCWQHCLNMADLADGFWQSDFRWEDPFCPYCSWRSPGLVSRLVALKGHAWAEKRLAAWRKSSAAYKHSVRQALNELMAEWQEINPEAKTQPGDKSL